MDGFVGVVEEVCELISDTPEGESTTETLEEILTDIHKSLTDATKELCKDGPYPERDKLPPEALSTLRSAVKHHHSLLSWEEAFEIMKALGADTEEDRENAAEYKEFSDEIQATIDAAIEEQRKK